MADQSLIEVPITRTSFELLLQLAEEESRSAADVIHDALLREKQFRDVMRRSAEAMARMQEISERHGNCNMTLEEINEEIDAARREMAARAKWA
jgi:hypothetical protein